MADADTDLGVLFDGLDSFGVDETALNVDDGVSASNHTTTSASSADARASVTEVTASPPVDQVVSPSNTSISTPAPLPTSAAQADFFINPSGPIHPNWAFEATPPYDSYSSQNPFDGLPRHPQQSQQSQQQQQYAAWELPLHTNISQLIQQLSPSLSRQSQVASANPVFYATTAPVTVDGSANDAAGELVRLDISPDVLNKLTPAQQEKLKSIAMPSHLQYHSPNSADSPGSSASLNDRAVASSPEAIDPSKASSRKRKSSVDVDDDDDDEDDGQQPVKKTTAHNMIEKRYRTNLNDKIAALRDSVPALRIMTKSARGEDTTEDREELQGLTPAHKLNKATVLSKATEYIRHLEKRNARLIDENNNMKSRISAFEKLFMAGAIGGGIGTPVQQPPPLSSVQFGQEASAFLNTPIGTPRGPDPPGMVLTEDDMKRILAAQQLTANRPYTVPAAPYPQNAALLRQQQIQQQQQQAQTGRWNPYLGKLMVGSLAGLMLVEAFTERETSNETPEGRGLFGMPLPTHFNFGGHYIPASQLISHLRIISLLIILLWIWAPTFFTPRPPKSGKQRLQTAAPTAAPSLASPIHVRRQAWLTAIQTVWVPRHNFFLEAAALGLKTLKYAVRNVVGVSGYLWLTGWTEEQEVARVKAWSIALDAQLAGGDIEINKSRLTLTLIASGTLPDTPLRLMMKALHVRLLLWQFSFASGPANILARKLARSLWTEARQLDRILTQLRQGKASPDEELPEHLNLLLEQDCEEVLNDGIVQRAHNLAWNHPTMEGVVDAIDGMNIVVDDPAVLSPMDAISAWYSTLLTQRVLAINLAETTKENVAAESQKAICDTLSLAIGLAPIGSDAQVRGLVARAVLVDEKRGASIAAALQAMSPALNPDKHPEYSKGMPPLIDAPVAPIVPDPDVQRALRCAMAMAHLQRFAAPPQSALDVIDSILPDPNAEGLAMLGFAAAFHLMVYLGGHDVARSMCAGTLERLAGTLRIWVGSAASEAAGLDRGTRRRVVDRCLAITRSLVGMDSDPGYGTMGSDCDCGDACEDVNEDTGEWC